MSKATRQRAQARLQRRERLRCRFPIADRMLEDRAVARAFIEIAPLARVLIQAGVSPYHDFGLANHDAWIAILKDALGIAPLSEAEFEHALRLATPPECRETEQ